MLNLVIRYNLDEWAFVLVVLVGLTCVHLRLRHRHHRPGVGRVTWVAILTLLVVGVVVSNLAGEEERSRLRSMLQGIAPTYAQELERMGHARLGLDTPPDDPRYLSMINAEIRWLAVNRSVADIYTMRMRPDGKIAFLVDSETDYDHDGRIEGKRESRTPIGEVFPQATPHLLNAFKGKVMFDAIPYTDRWGTWVSAYVPMRDQTGRVESVLGVDYPASGWLRDIAWHRLAMLGSALVLIAILLSSTAGMELLRAEIARRRVVEEQLRRARVAAEAANSAKSEFVANVSHELRTPMTAILGYTDLLLDPNLAAEAHSEHIQTIRQNGEHLLAIINDILDLSKIEAQRMSVARIPCELCRILNEIESLMRMRAQEKHLDLTINIAGPVPQVIQTDPTRLRQILLNLVGNAIKFTPQGQVRISARMDQTGALAFEVADTGIGMSEGEISRLFEPFVQSDNSNTRSFGGTGLGLAISRRLARLLGGDISVRSELGKGSVFTLTVDPGPIESVPTIHNYDPAVLAHETAARPSPPARQLAGKILLAEDTAASAELFAHYLRTAGAEVTLAEHGQSACAIALDAAAAGNPFDLILMDMQMPEMDGFQATRKLRAAGITAPIIALTAHARGEDRDACLQCGCTDFLSKPMKRNELLEMIWRHLPENLRTAAQQAPTLLSRYEDSGDFTSLLAQFVADLPAQVNRILGAVQRNDLDALEDAVHQLKGSAGLYGFAPIKDAADEVEHLLHSRDSSQSASHAVEELISQVRRVKGYRDISAAPACPGNAPQQSVISSSTGNTPFHN